MSMAVHCDRDGCNTWQAFGADTISGWYKLSLSDDIGADPSKTKHFDTLDCLLCWTAANSAPPAEINGANDG